MANTSEVIIALGFARAMGLQVVLVCSLGLLWTTACRAPGSTGVRRSPSTEHEMARTSSVSSGSYLRPDKAVLKRKLSHIEYYVTQENGTEPPYSHTYNKYKSEGIYVDIVSGEPLFSSKHKFDSGTGWPSFTQPLVKEHVVEHKDHSFGMARTEVRSRYGDSHLGHVFPDGPPPTGLRYCINGSALRFVPVDELNEQGYAAYKELFFGRARGTTK